MIQFNLLPDVKLEFLKAQKLKRTIIVISTVVSTLSIVLFISLFVLVKFAQKQHIKNLTKDIDSAVIELKNEDDLEKILTVQNQLNRLPELHDKKPVTSRLFNYLPRLVPAKATLSQLNIDFGLNTISFQGQADSIETVNKFVDTIKFAKFNSTDEAGLIAFSEVVLQNFGRDAKGASFIIVTNFNPDLFSSDEEITLVIPKLITTRSEIEKPGVLFEKPATGDQ